MKKSLKKLMAGAVLTSVVLASGITTASANELEADTIITPMVIPVEASFTPANTAAPKGTVSKFIPFVLKWGGGGSSTYNVQFYDGEHQNSWSFNKYQHSYSKSYAIQNGATRGDWSLTLNVANTGSSDSAYGSVTLLR